MSSYVIRFGPLKGKAIEDVDHAFLQQAVSMRIQPDELFNACRAELLRRGEDLPQPPVNARPEAFSVPPPKAARRIPDSLAEIAAAGSKPPEALPQLRPPSVSVPETSLPVAPRLGQHASAGESIPMPCGHPTSDLGWLDDSKLRSTCVACQRIASLKSLSDPPLDGVLRLLESEARLPGWPHTVSSRWKETVYGPPDEDA